MDLIVVNVTTLGQQDCNAFGGVVGTTAADANQSVRLQVPGRPRRFLKDFHGRVGSHAGKEASAPSP